MELYSERVPQVLLLVLGLVPVDRQPDSLWGLPQHIDGFIVAGFAQVDAVHLWREEMRLVFVWGCPIAATTGLFYKSSRKTERNGPFQHSTVLKIRTIVHISKNALYCTRNICYTLCKVHFKVINTKMLQQMTQKSANRLI